MFRVLLLDDDAFFNRNLGRSLRRSMREFFEFELYTVQTAEEAYMLVSQAEHPFDVFLIDQRLGPELDGIEALRNLMRYSPSSDSIVFTLQDDIQAGARAYQAGAYRYLHKPFEASDVANQLRSLYDLRRTRHERDRLRILTSIAEHAQKAESLAALGKIIVEGALEFGFQRARLWLLDEEHKIFRGLMQATPSRSWALHDRVIPENGSVYISKAFQMLTPTIFNADELGPTYMMQHYNAKAPVGQWVAIPLRIDERISGILMLDNHNRPRSINNDQLTELKLLGQQAAAAIERIQRIESEQQRSHTLAEISRIIGHQAAGADLGTLLKHIHRHIHNLMEAHNCVIALHDRNRRQIKIQLEVIANHRRKKRTVSARTGIISTVIRNGKPVYLHSKKEIEALIELEHIRPDSGDINAHSLMGVPLQLKQEVIGAIIIRHSRREYAYSHADLNLLTAIASQVAGAIKATHLRDEMVNDTQTLTLLQHASETLLGITRQSEEWLWHVALTVCTAGYALSFNRAMLFLLDNSQELLIGRMAIGHLDERCAHQSWEDDEHRNITFDIYLDQLQKEQLSTSATPIDALIRHYMLPICDDMAEILRAGKPKIIAKNQVGRILSHDLTKAIGKNEYLITPLMAGRQAIGIIVLDNSFNHQPLQQMPIKYLTNWLGQVGLAYSNFRQRSANDQLLHTINMIFSRISNQTLAETLEQLSEAAATTTGADCVIVYPLLPGSERNLPLYDFSHTVSKGLLHDFDPRQSLSIANATLQALKNKESLVVTNVDTDIQAQPKLIAMRPFLQRERIKAFIAAPIEDNNTEALAALFIGYRRSVRLTEADQQRVAAFAKSCGAAIDTAHANDREPEIIRSVLTKALEPGANLDSIAEALLNAARETLHVSHEMVGLVLRQWERQGSYDTEPREVRLQYYINQNGTLVRRTGQDLFTGITGKALQDGIDLNIGDVSQPEWSGLFRNRFSSDEELSPEERMRIRYEPEMLSRTFETRSELDVLIRQGRSLILGLFNIESPQTAVFSDLHLSRMRRLATAAGIALGMIYRQQNLETILTVTQTVVQAFDLKTTLEEVVKAAQEVALTVSAITLWYLDPLTKHIIPGPHFGVRQPIYMRQNIKEHDNIMYRVMRSPDPFWVNNTSTDQRLNNYFVEREGICSVAAFSLMVQQQPVGAIFFNYRNPHHFTDEERLLFPLLASYAATAIQDALQLEELNAEKQRIEAALRMTQALGTGNSLDEILESAMEILYGLFERIRPCVLIYNPSQRILTFAQAALAHYTNTENIPRLDIDSGPSIVCQVAHAALEKGDLEILNISNVHSHADYLSVIETTQSQLTISLMSTNRELLGMLVLESDRLDAFNQHDEKLVIGISQVLSVAIERAMQNRELNFQRSVANAAGWFAEIAHDIKREIGTISKRAYLLRERLPHELRPMLLSDLLMIEESATRLASFAKSPQESEPSQILIDEWLCKTVDLIYQQQLARYQSDVILEWKLQCGQLVATLSTILLERALRHLIRNAFEAMPEGGTLTLFSYPNNSHQFCLLVRNSGSTFHSDVREKIFFEPATSKLQDADGSMHGRGLMYVRWEIEAMGGRVELASRPAEPVTFRITLPIERPLSQKGFQNEQVFV